jgi:hypothetical protein
MTLTARLAYTDVYALSVLSFEIVFPMIGCAVIAVGVLMVVFKERAAKIQEALNDLTVLGRLLPTAITPEFARVSGIIIASFGGLWLLGVVLIVIVSALNPR